MPDERQIFYRKPVWANLEEISRDEKTVTFRTRSGTIQAFLKDVEAFQRSEAQKR